MHRHNFEMFFLIDKALNDIHYKSNIKYYGIRHQFFDSKKLHIFRVSYQYVFQ